MSPLKRPTKMPPTPTSAEQSGYLQNAPLGEKTPYIQSYDPHLIYPIDRSQARLELNMTQELPFFGADLWTAHELSWLNSQGKPQVAAAWICVPANSHYLIESKSFKLYLNSFNQTAFSSHKKVENTLIADLSNKTASAVTVTLLNEQSYLDASAKRPVGINIDDLAVTCSIYHPDATLLSTLDQDTSETLTSNLLKSNCPVTGQPDWAKIIINYHGPTIVREDLLKYIVSYRHHAGFHEQCVEKIFLDIKTVCRPKKLTVYARYTRRGGLDINPFRSDFEGLPLYNERIFRQ